MNRVNRVNKIKKLKFGMFVVLINILLAAQLVSAQSVNTLLAQPERPTIEQVAKADIDTSYNYPVLTAKFGQLDFAKWNDILANNAPHFIATVEKAFPGATWAFIGRDANALADVMEAFYLSIGQKNRVVRIGVSKKTFVNATDQELLKLLKTHGLDFEHFNEKHPYILVDTVSEGFGRQGRSLLQAVYNSYGKLGRNISDLLEKTNMVGLIVRTFRQTHLKPNPIENKTDYMSSERMAYLGDASNLFRSSHVVMTYDDEGTYFSESGYEHFTAAWHGSYGSIVEKDGSAKAEIGPATSTDAHLAILKFQKELISKVNKPEFLTKVQAAAKKLGYEFPIVRPAAVKIDQTTIEDVVTEDIVKYVSLLNQNNLVAQSETTKNLDKLAAIIDFANKNKVHFTANKLPFNISLLQAVKLGPKYANKNYEWLGKVASMLFTWHDAQKESSAAYTSTAELLKSLPDMMSSGLISANDASVLFWQAVNDNKINAQTIDIIKNLREKVPVIADALSDNNSAAFKLYVRFVAANPSISNGQQQQKIDISKSRIASLKAVLNSPKACSMLLAM